MIFPRINKDWIVSHQVNKPNCCATRDRQSFALHVKLDTTDLGETLTSNIKRVVIGMPWIIC
jgi:hypothetical protein